MKTVSIAIGSVDLASVEGLPEGSSALAVLEERDNVTNLYFRAPDTGRGYVLTLYPAQLGEADVPAAPIAEVAAAANAAQLARDAEAAAAAQTAADAEAEAAEAAAEAEAAEAS